MKEVIQLSVVIPCFNGTKTITTQLEALANQKWSEPWEVIFVDNGSTDKSRAIVEQYKDRLPNLHIIDAPQRRGRAYSCNVGIKAARGEALVFCDVDDEVAPGWLAAMGEALSKHNFVVCQHDDEKLNEPWIREAWNIARNGPPVYFGFLPSAAGCRIGFKRSLYDAIGEFDETMVRAEDLDYCWRIQLAGEKLHFVPEAVVHYRFRETLLATFQQARLDGASKALIFQKYAPLGLKIPSWRAGVRGWLKLLKGLLKIRRKAHLLRWVAQFGDRVGRLQGSIKHRISVL